MVIQPAERERFRALMRMLENFSGCRVLSYCIMSNHFHMLLEVPPMPQDGLDDAEFERRLRALYPETTVADVVKRMAAARTSGNISEAAEILASFTYRMHSLSEFMKSLLQRFTGWFNRLHSRSGTLWEERFKSVIVEDGTAARANAAYIDLNPVRAGIVADPAEYRWSSYGEAIGGGAKGDGKKARAGLVRAWRAHQGTPADAAFWDQGVAVEYRRMLMRGAVERTAETIDSSGKSRQITHRKGISSEAAAAGGQVDGEIPWATVLRCRVRYFTDGAVIGSRAFVDEVFAASRERFGPGRKDGARRMRGAAAPAGIWSARDLRKNVV